MEAPICATNLIAIATATQRALQTRRIVRPATSDSGSRVICKKICRLSISSSLKYHAVARS